MVFCFDFLITPFPILAFFYLNPLGNKQEKFFTPTPPNYKNILWMAPFCLKEALICKSIKDIGPLFSLFDYPLLYVDTFYLNPPWKFFDPNPSKLPTFFMDGPFLLKRGLIYDLNVTIFWVKSEIVFCLKEALSLILMWLFFGLKVNLLTMIWGHP